MKPLRIGIATYEEMKARTLAIARGTLRPAPDEPKVWFPSTETLERVLADKNHALAGTIAQLQSKSHPDLAETTRRKKSGLSRTVLGLGRPVGKATLAPAAPASLAKKRGGKSAQTS